MIEFINNNPMVKYALIIIIVFLVGSYLYTKWTELLKKQEREPIFIRKVQNGKKPGQFSGQRIPVPENGSSYTFMTWLHVSDWDYRKGKWKHVFHKGGKRGHNAQPGIWIDPEKNDLHIRFDTLGKPPNMVAQEGAPDYLAKIIQDWTDKKHDQNIVLKINGFERDGDKTIQVPKISYGDILRLEPNAEEIIVVLPPNQKKLTKNSMPLAFVIIKENNLADITKKRNLLPSKSAPDWNGETYYTINPSRNEPSLNPMIKNSVTNVEGLSNNVENFPLNRWFHLAVICNDRSCDVFVDGKLYKSAVLNSYAKQNNGDLFVCQEGGFGGMITQLRYYNKAMNLDMIKFIYDLGPNPPQLPDLNALFNKYKPNLNIKLDVDISVNGEEYDLDEMASDVVKTGVDTLEGGLNKLDSNL